MDKIQELTKQAEKIQQYGINEGFCPNDECFSCLSSVINAILDLSEHGYDETTVVDSVIQIQDEMLRLLMDDYGFTAAISHAIFRYLQMRDEAGEYHEGKL